jgi:hypothetical protein
LVISSTTSNDNNDDEDVIDLDAALKTPDYDTSAIVHDKDDDEYNLDDFIVTVNDNYDDTTCDNNDDEKDLNNEYSKNPATTFPHRRNDVTGLQTWTSMNTLLSDLYGGRLLLVILPIPSWCNNNDNNNNKEEEENRRIQQLANEVADMLDETFISFSSSNQIIGGNLLQLGVQHNQLLQRPLVGIMENSSNGYDTQFINMMGNITHYPAYKFIMTVTPPLPHVHKRNNNDDTTTTTVENDNDDDDDDVYDSQLQSWDYIGVKESSIDIYESIIMYWYRNYLSFTLGNYSKPQSTITTVTEEGDDIIVMDDDEADDDDDDDNDKPPYYTFSSINNLIAFLQDHGEYILRPSKTALRHRQTTMSKLELEVFDYYMRTVYGDGTDDDDVIDMYNDDNGIHVGTKNHNDDSKAVLITDEIDPYLLVVQCRSIIDHNYDHISVNVTEQTILKENQLRAMYEFDNLAMEMIHRKDVAFFALDATDKNGRIVCGDDVNDNGLFSDRKGPPNGVVTFIRIPRYVDYTIEYDEQNKKQRHQVARNVRTDWDDINSILPRAMFIPATTEKLSEEKKEIHGKFASKDPMIPKQYVRSNLIAATVVHATPTVMWYDDKIISQLAFPWYRKVHAVLFVDMALSHKISPRLDDTTNILMNNRTSSWPASVHYTNVTRALLYNQRLAIRMFYKTARRHRKDRPNEDAVFLIVPSSETRIMTAFGIDIWTPLDEALFGGVSFEGGERNDDNARNSNGRCNMPFDVESQSILPIMMITDSSGRSGMQASRYYLCSDDILPTRSKTNKNAMNDFVESFFNDTIGKPFVRSDTAPTSTSQRGMRRKKNINQPNVTILTGNTFESLVMDRHEEHTMLLMQANTCGHCKRFSIFWNELSSLVQVMNWSSVISVMKIDVTKNDVPHSKVNAWDLPSVYYFPANQKDEPIELPTPSSVSHNNHQYSYDEGLSWIKSGFDLIKWMIEQGKLDLDLLSKLDGSSTMDGESLVDDLVK